MTEHGLPSGYELLLVNEREQVDELKAAVGLRLENLDPYRGLFGQRPFYTSIHRDAVHNFAWAVDDLNPLWIDPLYGMDSRAGCALAPPSFLFPLGPGGLSSSLFRSVGTLFGEHGTWGGVEFEWFAPLRVGTEIQVQSELVDVSVRPSRLSAVMVQLTALTSFRSASGELVGTARSWVFRRRRASYGEGLIRSDLTIWRRDEIAAIENESRHHERRGDKPRWWADVALGDSLQLLKGPYSLAANICFLGAWHNELHGRGDIPWDESGSWPAGPLGFPQSVAGTGHYDAQVARERGLPGPYDYGPQRVSWAIQALTDWAGDDAFLESLRFKVQGYNFVGDVQRFEGHVVNKRVEQDRHLVDIDISCRNQLGQVTGSGDAVVALPGPVGAHVPSCIGRPVSDQ